MLEGFSPAFATATLGAISRCSSPAASAVTLGAILRSAPRPRRFGGNFEGGLAMLLARRRLGGNFGGDLAMLLARRFGGNFGGDLAMLLARSSPRRKLWGSTFRGFAPVASAETLGVVNLVMINTSLMLCRQLQTF